MLYPFGLCADLHFHPWSAFALTDVSGINSRLAGLRDEVRRCAQEVHEAGGQIVVFAGDIFHVRGSVSPVVLNTVRDVLQECVAKFGVEFIILAGNHDLEGRDSNRLGSAVTALEMDMVTVINEPTIMDEIVLVPWVESIDDLKETIANLAVTLGSRKDQFDLILHAPIDGVIEGLPAHGLTGEWLADLGFRRVFAGHYHNYKLVHEGANLGDYQTSDVYSIGALAHHTWSDVGTKAGFLLVERDDVIWRKSHLPQFIDVDKLTEVDPDDLPFMIDGNYVRVKLESASSAEVAELREELNTMGARGVLIQAVPAPPKRDDGVAVVASAGGSLEASLGEFTRKFDDKAADVLKEALAVLTAADEVEA